MIDTMTQRCPETYTVPVPPSVIATDFPGRSITDGPLTLTAQCYLTPGHTGKCRAIDPRPGGAARPDLTWHRPTI